MQARFEVHLYWSNQGGTTISRATLDGTRVNRNFIRGASGPIGVAVDDRASSLFCFGKVKKNKRRGTARLPVKLPGPGKLELRGKGLKTVSRDAHTRRVKLPVRSR